MRRYIAGILLLVFVAQTTGTSAASTTTSQGARLAPNGIDRTAPVVAVERSRAPAPLIRHTPVPRRPLPDYRNPLRYARLIPKGHGVVKEELVARPVDLTKRRAEVVLEHRAPRPLALQPSVTGILPWWTYQTRSIPGVGTALVNVANLNFLLAATDVDIAAGELDLAFQRVYNSQSQHNKNNDDGTGPSVYGNRWTNNLDVRLGWSPTSGNTGTVSVYTADGARDDYSCDVASTTACAPPTGVHDLLAPTEIGAGGVACQFQWTLKSGVSYIFNAPYQGCGFGLGSYGKLQRIWGRNTSFFLRLTYSWSGGDDSNPENLTQITVTHQPDGAELVLNFGYVAGSDPQITELMSIVRPDGETVNYHYASNGNLSGVDTPGNNPLLPYGSTLPTEFADGSPIAPGNLPQTYDVASDSLLEVCGPRAAITILNGNTGNNKADGACADFDYKNHQLTDWYTRGVLNPIPDDSVIAAAIQSSPSPGAFTQWDDTAFFNGVASTNCGSGVMTQMSDVYGHAFEWCYDSSGRITQTWRQASANTWLATSQTWDANNDLTTATDARGNTTKIAYDSMGNVVEVSLPSQATSQGTVRPTYLIDHDAYNNVTNICDPANNPSNLNSWNPSPGPTPCASGGSTAYTKLRYDYVDPNEIFGCLNASYTPSNYHRSITYGGGCGTGSPTEIAGDSYSESDGTNRKPTQTFTYGNAGNVAQYGPGNPGNATWVVDYTNNKMKWIRSVADPDGVTSYRCYNSDGSVFYSETAKQHNLDGSPSGCAATPPPYAVVYGYDADGNVATTLHHHNCPDNNGACAAGSPPPSAPKKCYSVAVLAGTTCDFYDGLDRLVEVRLPYDSSADLYTRPWIMRYLYDLTGGTYQFDGSSSFYAHGNLFESEELLPQSPTATVTAPPTAAPGTIDNSSYEPVKATAYDGLDRPVTKYSANGILTPPYSTETLTWDTSPIGDGNVAGLLGQDCNSFPQCQEFYYEPNGALRTFKSSDGSSAERDYTYDPDGRPTKIVLQGYNLPQTYSYDADGNPLSSADAAGNASNQATLTHHRYPDGLEQTLDVSNAAFTQTGLFTYSYRNDGPLKTEVINDTSLGSAIQNPGQTTLSYKYTDAGRLSSRTESGVAAYPSPSTTITYGSAGLVTNEVTPVTTLSNFNYTAESELTSVKSSSDTYQPCGVQNHNYSYTLRGELVSGCPGALPFFANGVSLRTPILGVTGSKTWNNRMAVMTSQRSLVKDCNGNTDYCRSSWVYDNAGRMKSEVGPYPVSTSTASPAPSAEPPDNTTTARTYDAENHLITTQRQNGATNSWANEVVHWGPDGHPIKIGTYVGQNSANEVDERLHWNGNQLLFTTHPRNGEATLDDVKVDVKGDILVGDSGYSGLTFYDRDRSGTIMGCHNAMGTSYGGVGDGWATKTYTPCTGSNMPTSGVWGANPYAYNFSYGSGGGIGNGSTLTMPRPDGINDGFDTLQGIRSYDNAQGSWTTPDAYAGNLADPLSQMSYLWNGNNPIANMDPTGFIQSQGQPVEPEWCDAFCIQQPGGIPGAGGATGVCDAAADVGCGASNATKPPREFCGNAPCVTSRAVPRQFQFPCTGPGGESEVSCGSLVAGSPWDWIRGLLSPPRIYQVVFNAGHFWNQHLAARISSLSNLEAAINSDLQARVAADDTLPESLSGQSQTFTFEYNNGGTMVPIAYRAFLVDPPGYINVGTVYIP